MVNGRDLPVVRSSASAHVAVISTDPADLPYYAARSLLRVFIAFFLSGPDRRAGMRGDLRHLHLDGLEHDVQLGRLLTFEIDDLLPIVDAAKMLGFADADIELTAEGKILTPADDVAA